MLCSSITDNKTTLNITYEGLLPDLFREGQGVVIEGKLINKKLINKKVGLNVAHNLGEENPNEVKDWIPTGSRWLNSMVCRGKLAGIPVGKISEIAGLESTGKSFLAAQVDLQFQIVIYLKTRKVRYLESSKKPTFILVNFYTIMIYLW